MKTSKLIIVIFGLLFSSTAMYAQQKIHLGISGGINRNTLTTDEGYRAFTIHRPMNGFQIGLPLQYDIRDWLAVQVEPAYIKKNYELKRTEIYSGIGQQFKNGYLQLPIMARFSFGGQQLKGFLNLGGYAAYWLNGRIKGTVLNIFDNVPDIENDQQIDNYSQYNNLYRYNEKFSFDHRRDQRWEFGLLAGIGLEYRMSASYKVFIEGRYYYSLSDQQKNYMINQIPRYNNTLGVQIGILVDISHHRH